ncbi:tRNA pseudouridine synthase D [Sulfolobus acidocaldarius SUSAZ]|nr:tRNA pseudouridine synthase D [Sulfolobus acidocaldarius SUSAZ]
MNYSDLDSFLGLEKYYIQEEWEPLQISINRPEGFKVIEEISETPVNEWKGESNGTYSAYLLTKKGIDHFSVINMLKKLMKRKIHYLGIKDANAITQQIIYVKGNPPITSYDSGKFEIRFVGHFSRQLNHTGNRFEIELSTTDQNELQKRLHKLSTTKFLFAYIGYQRFGTKRPVTHIVGKYLLLKDWCQAVDWIVGHPFSTENENLIYARRAYEQKDFETSLQLFPRKFKDEINILKSLMNGDDCLAAIKKIVTPHAFFVEAYQSFLYNKYLSKIADRLRGKESEDLMIRIPSDLSNVSDDNLKEIVHEENIENTRFNVKELKIRLRDFTRSPFMKLRNIKIKQNKISFSLDRGMYATTVLREISRYDPKSYT